MSRLLLVCLLCVGCSKKPSPDLPEKMEHVSPDDPPVVKLPPLNEMLDDMAALPYIHDHVGERQQSLAYHKLMQDRYLNNFVRVSLILKHFEEDSVRRKYRYYFYSLRNTTFDRGEELPPLPIKHSFTFIVYTAQNVPLLREKTSIGKEFRLRGRVSYYSGSAFDGPDVVRHGATLDDVVLLN